MRGRHKGLPLNMNKGRTGTMRTYYILLVSQNIN